MALVVMWMSMLSIASATVRIVYDSPNDSKTYYDDDNYSERYYFYQNGERCYYDKYGSKKCVDYNSYDYNNYTDRYWNKCSYRDYDSGKDVCYYTNNRNNDDYDDRYDEDDDRYDDYDYDRYDEDEDEDEDEDNLDYTFGHYPVSNIDITYYSDTNPYIKYEWDVSASVREVSSATLNEVFDFVEDTWYFKFFKFFKFYDVYFSFTMNIFFKLTLSNH